MSIALLGLVAAGVFGVAVALTLHVVHPRLRPRLGRLPAPLRARLVLALLAAPAVVGIALSLLALLPGIAASLAPGLDHCTHHDDHHFHLCVVHGPTAISFGRAWLVLGLVMVPIGARIVAAIARLLRGRRLLSTLRRSASPSPAGYHVVDSKAPFAVTAGLLRPQVYLTTGLLRELDVEYQAAVLAHEAAHVRRRDPLTKFVAELLGVLHLPATRRALLAELSLACERVCDEEAARTVGDRTTVAGALVELGRRVSDAPAPPSVAVVRFGEGNITTRVLALLQPPAPTPRLPSPALLTGATVLLAVILCGPVHHVTETVLGHVFA